MSARLEEHEKKEVPSPSLKRAKFSKDTINDLIFWGFHLCIVAIALAIVWNRIDRLTVIIAELVTYQAKESSQRVVEVNDTKDTLQKIIEGTNNNFREAEKARKSLYDDVANSVQVLIAKQDELQGQLESKVAKIQIDVSDSLGKINKIAEQIGIAAQQSQQEAQQAQTVAAVAKGSAAKARTVAAVKTKQLKRAKVYIKKLDNRNLLQRIFNTQYVGGTKQ